MGSYRKIFHGCNACGPPAGSKSNGGAGGGAGAAGIPAHNRGHTVIARMGTDYFKPSVPAGVRIGVVEN